MAGNAHARHKHETLAVGVCVGHYELVGRVGFGHLGQVYQVRSPREPGRKLALKVVPNTVLAATPKSRATMVDALEKLMLIKHPNLVGVVEVGQHDGQLFYVMPLQRPLTLRHLIDQKAPLQVRTARKILQQVTSALAAAHSELLFHGRLQPDNVFVEPMRSERNPIQVTLGAFGLTGTERPDLTHWAYAPPEIADPAIDKSIRSSRAAADIYAVGCIAVEMLTGKPPLVGATRLATMRLRLKHDFTWPKSVQRSLPPDLMVAVEKALVRHRPKRTATAFELLRGFKAGTRAQLGAAPPKISAKERARVRRVSQRLLGAAHPDAPKAPNRPRVIGRGQMFLVAGRPCMIQVLEASPTRWKIRAYLQGQTLRSGEHVGLTFASPTSRDGVRITCRVDGPLNHFAGGVSSLEAEVLVPPDAEELEALFERWGVQP